MTIPPESQWERMEAMVETLRGLEPECAEREMEALKEAGEPPSVLNLVKRMLELPALPQPLQEGDVLAERYTLREKLGEGGMGTVWRATHGMIGHDVAAKMLHFGLLAPELTSRFQVEMEILGRLEHRGIVRIVDAGVHRRGDEREIPYLAMDLVQGVPLNRWAAEHRGELGAILRVAQEICAAVQHAHDRKIIHRDLKPSNILVRADGTPVILDFGLARAAGVPEEESGYFCGTPEYAAPEQFFGNDRGFRSGESVDVYAVGAILFEMLAGRRLFEFPGRPTLAEMLRTFAEEKPARLAALLPGCPPLLDEVVARAVRRDPADRYYSIGEFARALSRVAGSIEAPAMPEPPRWMPATGAMVPGSQWRLQSKLGAGSSGEVWLGMHEQLGEWRVFKFCDSLEKVHTLKRELTLYRMLKEKVGQNPHFIPLHEVSLEEPPWYLMMDYVDALDLEAWCGCHEGISEETFVEIVAQVGEALQAAHESGILHRDIKPGNILVSEGEDEGTGGDEDEGVEGGGERGRVRGTRTRTRGDEGALLVRVADFGIGQIVADELQRSGTRQGFTRTLSNQNRFSGTLLYMAPEVLEGGEATARSDVYSLGVVFWQLLSGNLQSALDPEWAKDVSDPLLREDLRRCLARVPGKRWSSAGEFTASLRALPERRVAEARRQADLAARERAAYRRGVLRTAAVAIVILLIVVGLAIAAGVQRREAQIARGRSALAYAGNLLQLENKAGRRALGLNSLEEAAAVLPDERDSIRTLAAGLFSLLDLRAVPPPVADADSMPVSPPASGETVRVASTSGALFAIGHDSDRVQGTVDFIDAKSGEIRHTLRREGFPSIPVPEPGFVQFSPDDRLLAVAGPKTSLHILLGRVDRAGLQSYIYAGDGMKCMAWHPGSRILATGDADRIVRLWDIESGQDAKSSATGKNEFDLPPGLSTPAIDAPCATLKGWRDAICSIAFDPGARWMAALDQSGGLRIFSGFIPAGLPGLPLPGQAANLLAREFISLPPLLLEIQLEHPDPTGRLEFIDGTLVVSYAEKPRLAFVLEPGAIFRETWVAPAIREVAWSDDGAQLCVISDTDIFWLKRETLELIGTEHGKNADAVVFDRGTAAWALANQKGLVHRMPIGTNSSKVVARSNFAAAEEKQAARLGIAASAERLAVYFGKRLQFFRQGKPESKDLSIVTGAEGGTFQELLWDRDGTLAIVVYATASGLRAECYQTHPESTSHAWTCRSTGQLLRPAGDGKHLYERGTASGLRRIDASTGEAQSLDASAEARQNAPLAVSADGKWIAAVANRHVVRLIDTAAGRHYADFPVPRSTTIEFLTWHPSGEWLAGLTDDGYVLVWSLGPWRAWLASHGLND